MGGNIAKLYDESYYYDDYVQVSPLLVSHDGFTFDGGFASAITPSFDSGAVYALVLLNSKLYVGGQFWSPARSLAQWNGTGWSAVGGSLNSGATVKAMAAFDDGLVIAGSITKAGILTVANIAYWTGVKWATLGAGLDDEVLCVLEHNGLLYAGGWFESSGGVELNYIAAWNGVQWLSLDGGLGGIIPQPYGSEGNYLEPVTVLATYQGELVVSGYFSQAGNTPMTVLALWNDTVWVDYFGVEQDEVDAFYAMLELPDGRLLGVGDFINWGIGNSPSRITLWSNQSWHNISPRFTNLPLYTLAHAFGVVYISGVIDYWPPEYYGGGDRLAKGIWIWDPADDSGDVALLIEVLGMYVETMLPVATPAGPVETAPCATAAPSAAGFTARRVPSEPTQTPLARRLAHPARPTRPRWPRARLASTACANRGSMDLKVAHAQVRCFHA